MIQPPEVAENIIFYGGLVYWHAVNSSQEHGDGD